MRRGGFYEIPKVARASGSCSVVYLWFVNCYWWAFGVVVFMKISELGSIVSLSKGMKQDRQRRDQIKHRQDKRRDIEDINQFMATLAAICPQYYGSQND